MYVETMMASGPFLSTRRRLSRMATVATSLLATRLITGVQAKESGVQQSSGRYAVILSQNTSPTGPCNEAIRVSDAITPHLQHYWPHGDELSLLGQAASKRYGIAPYFIKAWSGSSDPAFRAVVAFTGPMRGLVMADPSWELIFQSAPLTRAPVHKVPLTQDYAHDVKSMRAANPHAGLYFICNPNNPTGTLTPYEDIVWLLKHKPRDAVVLVDEAYIEFSDAESCIPLVEQGHDIIVLRTFSKIYGMAGMRLGFTIGRPDLIERLLPYGFPDSPLFLSMNAVVAGTASLQQNALVPARKKANMLARDETFAFLRDHGVGYIPSDSNCFLLDVRRPGAEFVAAMAQQGIMVGRSWPIWPTRSRITVGSANDMADFRHALSAVMSL